MIGPSTVAAAATVTATAPLSDIGQWARGSGLEVVMLVSGALLLTRFATWLGDRVTTRIDVQSGVVRSESAKHRHAVAQVITWTSLVIVYCLTAVLVLQRFSVPVTGFVAPATIVGVALGFGAQKIVQDMLAGFFIIAERQYGFGDLVRLMVAGGPAAGSTGTVEEVTLRITRLRTSSGEVVTTSNSQIVQVVNLSRDWARAIIDVPIPAAADLATVSELLTRVGAEAYADDALHDQLLDAPAVMGVESLDLDEYRIRVVARTQPGRQFEVGRALRARIATTLLREGITAPAELDTAAPTAS
ncbi:mechanosensitive ion channel family protein [Frankia sp. AgKG'84/4]|uniref:mechanosensitive ion channel family protein n=1 Tax=Frankia sp. AgKG'84/4 TaxID=573490 RepID=UPI00200E8F22|nr:mechanosensitive ion channel family protein [Frankia sp. AgKG'84/4]MCL9796534.1 mechanosensitive ion channel family protein [Frankia sp. AgKG'84/4]